MKDFLAGIVSVLAGMAAVIAIVAVVVGVALAVSAACGFVFMLLWNFAVVAAFPSLGVLTFYKAWALWFFICLIANVLFRRGG